MDPLHQRLARIAFDAGDDLGLVLAGGYAISAHRLTERPSRDLDLATASRLPLDEIMGRLLDAYRAEGFTVAIIESSPLMARIEVTSDDQLCEVDLLKEAIGPPVMLEVGPVLALDDAVGLKVGALHDRATHRDFIDVHAAHLRGGYTLNDLERLGARHLRAFSLAELMDRLGAVELRDDLHFFDYGLSEADVRDLRIWVASWADDIRQRVSGEEVAAGPSRDGPTGTDTLRNSLPGLRKRITGWGGEPALLEEPPHGVSSRRWHEDQDVTVRLKAIDGGRGDRVRRHRHSDPV